MNINKELASALDADGAGVAWRKDGSPINLGEFDYRDPAVFVECLEYLLKHGYRLGLMFNGEYAWYRHSNLISESKCVLEAAALARIEAGKQ